MWLKMFEFKKYISYRFILLGHLIVSAFIAKSLRPKAAEREVIWGEAAARVPGTLVITQPPRLFARTSRS